MTRSPWPGLRLPLIVSPMFLVSSQELVVESCRAGVVGTFPALNFRTSAEFDLSLTAIREALDADVPYGVNLILHPSNVRLEQDLSLCLDHKVPLLITSLGINGALVERVHDAGTRVFHDVTTLRHAKKAADAGVDGLILVCAGAGGHAGTVSPFALLPEVQRIFPGTIVLAGAISDGRAIAAALMLGADMVYVGTRFIATRESSASEDYKRMILDGDSSGVVYTDGVSGVPGNFLRASLLAQNLDPDNLEARADGFKPERVRAEEEAKAWKNIWSAGQGIGCIDDLPMAAELVGRLAREYDDARSYDAAR